MHLKSINWKQYALLGGVVGYGLWQWNESMALAESTQKEKTWDELSKQEKDKLAENYIKNPEALTPQLFENLSAIEQNIIIHALKELLKNEQEIRYLGLFYVYFNERQKSILLDTIISLLKKNKPVLNLDDVYYHATEKHKSILFHYIVKQLQQENACKNIGRIYRSSLSKERNILFPLIMNLFKKGKIEFGDLRYTYEGSEKEQKDIIFSFVVEQIQKEKELDNIYWLFWDNEVSKRETLFPIIIELVKKGHSIKYLDIIYKELRPYADKQNILFQAIIDRLKKGQIVDGITNIYDLSLREEQNILFPFILEQIKQGNITDIETLFSASHRKNAEILFPFMLEKIKQGTLNNFDTFYAQLSKYGKENVDIICKEVISTMIRHEEEIKTQSIGHITRNAHFIYRAHLHKLKKNPAILALVKNIHQSECELTKQGYSLFYHAQMWDIFLLEILYTKLHEIKHQQSLPDYIFTRFMQDGPCSENATLLKEQKGFRKKIMKQGRFDTPSRYALLFLNYALFGNTTNKGSSSFDYCYDNSNVKKPDITIRDIFKHFGIEHIYEESKDQFDELIKNISSLSKHGNMLQIAIPTEHVKKYVYISEAGGPKSKIPIIKDIINYGYNNNNEIIEKIERRLIRTDDVQEVLELLKFKPKKVYESDKQELVMVVTDDNVQKAYLDGVKIKSFNTADPEKLQEVTNELENFLKEKLAGHWTKPEPTPWECYKKYKQK